MAFDAYMEIAGIKGDCTDKDHAEWIEIQSFSHGLSQQIGGSRSAGGAATAGRCDHQDFTVIKQMDFATPKLFEKCCDGEHISKIVIDLCRAGANPVSFMKFTLSDCVVSAISPGGSSGGGMPVESLMINYGKIEWLYNKTDPQSGKVVGKMKTGWDCMKNVKV
jgi:type VI secretion system secreted protein Hcp